MRLILTLLLILSMVIPALAWDGYDYDKRSYIEMQKNQQLKLGREIESYDYNDRQYKDVQINNINKVGNSIEVEVYDYKTHEYRTFDMNGQ